MQPLDFILLLGVTQSATTASATSVAVCRDLPSGSLEAIFRGFGIGVAWVGEMQAIPGSHWGEPEAGIRGNRLFVRPDTPVHSALHEGCHLIVMDNQRRSGTDTDAGGDDLEESAVCYLQILLAERLPSVGAKRVMQDMDSWGYSFRMGTTAAWFERDAEDARAWLETRGIFEALVGCNTQTRCI